jgi:hypothetical protein
VIVFHAPQASQRPAQREDAAPQLWQTKLCVRAAISTISIRYCLKYRDTQDGNADRDA